MAARNYISDRYEILTKSQKSIDSSCRSQLFFLVGRPKSLPTVHVVGPAKSTHDSTTNFVSRRLAHLSYLSVLMSRYVPVAHPSSKSEQANFNIIDVSLLFLTMQAPSLISYID